MPIDRLKTKGGPGDETLFVLRDPTHSEVCDVVERANRMGLLSDEGMSLDGMTVRQLDELTNRRQ